MWIKHGFKAESWHGFTVSRALVLVHCVLAFAPPPGALRYTSRARVAIRLRVPSRCARPKETAWKASGLLTGNQLSTDCVRMSAYPSTTARRHRSVTVVSVTPHSPSERKMTTGALFAHRGRF